MSWSFYHTVPLDSLIQQANSSNAASYLNQLTNTSFTGTKDIIRLFLEHLWSLLLDAFSS